MTAGDLGVFLGEKRLTSSGWVTLLLSYYSVASDLVREFLESPIFKAVVRARVL